MLIIALTLGSFVGLVLGLTGAGGGILAVPALTLGLGWSMTQASPIALLAVACAAAIGSIDGIRRGLVRIRAALLMSLTGILAAPFGMSLAQALPEQWLINIFAMVMLIVAVRLFRNASNNSSGDDLLTDSRSDTWKINAKTGRISWNATSILTVGLIGMVSGVMTGLLGVGGGFIIVPALLRYSNITIHGIIATSLMVIALISAGAVIAAMAQGNVSMSIQAWIFIVASAAGMLIGRRLAEQIPRVYLQRIFAIGITFVSIILLYKNV